MKQLVLIIHNVRSAHNVGSLLRTADGLGVERVLLTGYTPYPLMQNDERLPHLQRKIDARISKTALGAEKTVRWEHHAQLEPALKILQDSGYQIVALEQDENATALPTFHCPPRLALIVGREVEGIEPEILRACDEVIEIPMLGSKESFNVTQAAAMALYHCRYYP